MKKEIDFLNSWFADLEDCNIKYAVLRNYTLLPDSCGGSDMDIWIKKEDYDRFLLVTNDCINRNDGILAMNLKI